MEYVNLGKTGLKVSRLCLGCMSFGSSKWQKWVLDEDASIAVIKKAWELGINFFDTANVYSNGESERVLGKALKQLNVNREDVVIATKVFFRVAETPEDSGFYDTKPYPNRKGLSRKHIFASVEESLKRLQTDYIDLYQIHRWDYNTPIEETMEALHDLVKSGKVRYIGASSMFAWQFAKAQYYAKSNNLTPFVSMQNLYNLIYREEEREMYPLCKEFGVAAIPWSPLARGVLSGKPKGATIRQETDKFTNMMFGKTEASDNLIVERAKEIAAKYKVTLAQVAIAWHFAKPIVAAPIVGTSNPTQLEELVAALQIKLTAEEVKYLEELYIPHTIVGHQ